MDKDSICWECQHSDTNGECAHPEIKDAMKDFFSVFECRDFKKQTQDTAN